MTCTGLFGTDHAAHWASTVHCAMHSVHIAEVRAARLKHSFTDLKCLENICIVFTRATEMKMAQSAQ